MEACICGADGGRAIDAAGHAYVECHACGSLWLRSPAEDEASSYGDDYYSFTPPVVFGAGRLWLWLRGVRTALAIRLPTSWRRFLFRGGVPVWLPWLPRVRPSTAMLDVGSGAGRLVAELWSNGLQRAQGYDPYVRGPAFRVTSTWPEGRFGVVMFHHSLEHVADPVDALSSARAALTSDGTLIVRLPIADSNGWRELGTSWTGLDPPRHHFVPTREGMRLLAAKAGLRVVAVEDDGAPLERPGDTALFRLRA